MSDRRGAPFAVSGIALAEDINHLRGEKVDVINNPGGETRFLYLECERGEYRIRIGNISSANMPDDAIPKQEVTDGTGSIGLQEGQIRIIQAPDEVTIRGLSNKSVLTYYFA